MLFRTDGRLRSITMLLLLALSLNGLATGYKDYKGYKIYDVLATTQQQQLALQQLSRQSAYDFLSLSKRLQTPNKVLVAPTPAVDFVAALQAHGLNYTLVVDDVSVIIANERAAQARVKTGRPGRQTHQGMLNLYERYYEHHEINAYMEQLARQHPTRVFVKHFGRSYEQRDLKLITITNGDGRLNKKVIFIDACMHAREWIAPAMALHIINELVWNFEANAQLLLDYDWVIMPVVNADGYAYTFSGDRYWRKTRRPNRNDATGECPGTDPNRNFAHEWGMEEGASSDPCEETYRGDAPFSEPETRVVRDIMWTYAERAKFYLTLHSYGNMILLPWGHTSAVPDNFYDMMEIADAGAMAIVQATSATYTYGNTYDVIYPTSGDSDDYAAAEVGIPVTMAMELPAGGFSGFDPPVRQIEDIITETWIGIRAMAEAVVERY